MSNLVLYRKPQRGLGLFENAFGDLFNGFWNLDYAPTFSPHVEMREREKDYLLTLESPGLAKKDLQVTVEQRVLKIHGEKKAEQNKKEDAVTYSERRYGSFERSFRLPRHVDASNIKAKYADGILELTLPKTKEAAPKSIEVKVA